MNPRCEKCGGEGWRYCRSGAMRACECRTQASQPQGPPLNRDSKDDRHRVALEVAKMCQVFSYPIGELGQAVIVNALISMCSTLPQVRYVTEEATRRHNKWGTCGIQGLRQIVCSRFAPRDGITETTSEGYPDGLPPVHQEEPLQLAAGGTHTLDAGFSTAIARLGAAKQLRVTPGNAFVDYGSMPCTCGSGKPFRFCICRAKEREARETVAAAPVRRREPDVPINLNFTPITQADVDREVQKLHEAKALKEREGE